MLKGVKIFFLGESLRDQLRAVIRDGGVASLADVFRYGPVQLPQFCAHVGALLERPPPESELEALFTAAAGPEASVVGYAQLIQELDLAEDPTIGPDNPVDVERLLELFKSTSDGADSESRITRPEFRAALSRLGIHATTSELDALFDAMDTDGTGMLRQDQLRAQLVAGAAGLLSDPGTPRKGDDSPSRVGTNDWGHSCRPAPGTHRPLSACGSQRASSTAWAGSSTGSLRQWGGSNSSHPGSPRCEVGAVARRCSEELPPPPPPPPSPLPPPRPGAMPCAPTARAPTARAPTARAVPKPIGRLQSQHEVLPPPALPRLEAALVRV